VRDNRRKVWGKKKMCLIERSIGTKKPQGWRAQCEDRKEKKFSGEKKVADWRIVKGYHH